MRVGRRQVFIRDPSSRWSWGFLLPGGNGLDSPNGRVERGSFCECWGVLKDISIVYLSSIRVDWSLCPKNVLIEEVGTVVGKKILNK